jgi:hypothetical protein
MKKTIMILLELLVFALSTGCVQIVGYEKDYKGRVVDTETKQPISGVVVLGAWWSKMPTPAGSTSHFHNARETVTDEKGEFIISGKGLKILSNLAPVDIFIFKAGYEHFEAPWEALKEDILLRNIIRWEGDRAIIPVRKMTMQERRKEGTPSRPSIPHEKMKLLTEEVNKDRVERGLSPL